MAPTSKTTGEDDEAVVNYEYDHSSSCRLQLIHFMSVYEKYIIKDK
jgi:hypothetical protein